MAKKKEKDKKDKKDKKEKKEKKGKKRKKGKKEEVSEERREPRTAYDTAISTLGGTVCAYAVLTLLGIVLAVVFGVLAGL